MQRNKRWVQYIVTIEKKNYPQSRAGSVVIVVLSVVMVVTVNPVVPEYEDGVLVAVPAKNILKIRVELMIMKEILKFF